MKFNPSRSIAFALPLAVALLSLSDLAVAGTGGSSEFGNI
jgi:hypothetical protein